MPHVNVVICTPGHSVMNVYFKAFMETINELNKRSITWAWSGDYSSHVGDAREITLAGTKENLINETKPFHGNLTYDKLMWIDSDIAWKPEDFIKLYESDKDIISGAYLLATGEVVAYKEQAGQPYTYEEVLKMQEPVEVSGTGFGFICIKQGVFEKLSRPWFQSTPITVESKGEKFTFHMMGEDLSFCYRAKDAGFKIWFDPTVRVLHHKMMRLTWEGPQS